MRTDMNLLESWTLPENHPLKQAEREKAKEWQVDFSREGELGFVAVNEWVVMTHPESQEISFVDAA